MLNFLTILIGNGPLKLLQKGHYGTGAGRPVEECVAWKNLKTEGFKLSLLAS